MKTFLLSLSSWLQGHVYSLGSTLSAALTYIIEPELEAELGEEIQRLLQQMQEETPEERPLLQVQHPLDPLDPLHLKAPTERARILLCPFASFVDANHALLPQDILALAEARLSDASSAGVCRKLSSIGRRVLSIESVSAFQGHLGVSVHRRLDTGV